MGLGGLKKRFKEKIASCHCRIPGDDIWELLDAYEQCLEASGTPDERAEAAFLRGDVAFHMGSYHETVRALAKSLSIAKSPGYAWIESEAYNLLGMVFYFAGYEVVALNHYLDAIVSAKKSHSLAGEVSAFLNAGLLYQDLRNYRKAMAYYRKGYEVAESSHARPEMLLMLLCRVQEAQLLCRMGRFEEARALKSEIDSYYYIVAQEEFLLPREIYEVFLTEHFGTKEQLGEAVQRVRQILSQDEDYLEQIDFYVDFCSFLMSHDRKEDTREFLDVLHEKLEATEFLELQMQLGELEVIYQRQYGGEEGYTQACVNYVRIQEALEDNLKKFRQQNLADIESLHELEKQREEFEMQSKCDLATGLLNKNEFQRETEYFLSEHHKGETDVFVIIDIDDFKQVNDNYGHLIGDEVIVRLAELIKKYYGGRAACGRFGGDEFVIFLKAVQGLDEVNESLEELREEFASCTFGKNGEVHSTVTVGVSYNRDGDVPYSLMFSAADKALMEAKERGKKRMVLFEIKRGKIEYG